jgi:hypothetical protein
MRLSELLIQRGWVTQQQIDEAVEEQRRLRAAGVHIRLGIILIIQHRLKPEQLAAALVLAPTNGFGEFGEFLVRRGVLTREQLALALAQQATMTAEIYQKVVDRGWRSLPFGRRRRRPAKPVPLLGDVVVSMGLLSREEVDRLHQRYQSAFFAAFY